MEISAQTRVRLAEVSARAALWLTRHLTPRRTHPPANRPTRLPTPRSTTKQRRHRDETCRQPPLARRAVPPPALRSGCVTGWHRGVTGSQRLPTNPIAHGREAAAGPDDQGN